MNYNPSPLRQKRKPIRDKDHLAFLHTLPCCITGYEGEEIECHHLLRVPNEERGAGMKSGDNWCIPLRSGLHWDLHHSGIDERDFLRSFYDNGSIYGPGLAAALWVLSGDEDACRRAIKEARGG